MAKYIVVLILIIHFGRINGQTRTFHVENIDSTTLKNYYIINISDSSDNRKYKLLSLRNAKEKIGSCMRRIKIEYAHYYKIKINPMSEILMENNSFIGLHNVDFYHKNKLIKASNEYLYYNEYLKGLYFCFTD